MAKRGAALDMAVLGLLHESPMHGYELRKRVNALLGRSRVLSYGTLYPCLKQLLRNGLIAPDTTVETASDGGGLTGRRARIVYKLTADGKEHFASLLAQSGPSSWDDDSFDVHFAFFGRTDAQTRVRILEGRRTRLEERLEGVRAALARTRERVDSYTLELQQHGLESVEREVRWLTELIDTERSGGRSAAPAPQTNRAPDPSRSERTQPIK